MNSRPLTVLAAPEYPTKLEIAADPGLLERNLPNSWERNAALGTIAAIALSASTGCATHGADVNQTIRDAGAGVGKQPVSVSAALAQVVVAPVFDHGEGRASLGCVSVAPPVFLSEEEVLGIIQDEGVKRGLRLTRSKRAITGVKIDEGISFSPTFGDDERRIAIEFVTKGNSGSFLSPEHVSHSPPSSVTRYDMRQSAQDLAENVRKTAKDRVRFCALYDPAHRLDRARLMTPSGFKGTPEEVSADFRARYDKGMNEAGMASKEDLRLQLVDCLNWLAAQGSL